MKSKLNLKLLQIISFLGTIMAHFTTISDPRCRDGDKAEVCFSFQLEADSCGWFGCLKSNVTVSVYEEQYHQALKNFEALNSSLSTVNASSQEKNQAVEKKAGELNDEIQRLNDLLLSKEEKIETLTTEVGSLKSDVDTLKGAMVAIKSELHGEMKKTAAVEKCAAAATKNIADLDKGLKEFKDDEGLKRVKALIASADIATVAGVKEYVDPKYEQLVWFCGAILFVFASFLVFLVGKYWLARNRGLVSMFKLL